MSTIPVEGDYVRVVLEGEVTFHYAGGVFDIGNNTVSAYASHVKSVEKIDKPAKAGDVLAGAEIERREWPAGTLIGSTENRFQLYRIGDDWVKTSGAAYYGLGDNYKILHLPEGTDD